jgi:hypothetical protein
MKSEGMKSGRALFTLAVSIGALAAACTDDTEPANRPAVADEAARAEPDPAGEPAPTDPQASANGPLERSRQAVERWQRDLFAGVELTADQERRLKELADARASWRAEHKDELNALRQQGAAARQAGDNETFEAARDRILQLHNDAPNPRDVLEELTVEQRAQVEQNRNRRGTPRKFGDESDADRERRLERQRAQLAERRKERFAAAGLSEDQQRRIGELGDARRAWHEQNQEQLRALREQQRAARLAGDVATEEQARKKLEELRATAPQFSDIFSELTDEQRAQFRQNRPDRKKAASAALGGVVQGPEDAAAGVPGPADAQPSPDAQPPAQTP